MLYDKLEVNMIRIITDSAADFEQDELQRLNITCIPLNVFFGDREYPDDGSLTKQKFYELLTETDTFPKTAQASPQILMDLFEEADKAGDDAIYITLSSALSGTYMNAVMTKNLVGSPRCHVVDSRNGTGGQRMLVEIAAKLRDEGKTAAEIVAEIEALRSRVTLYACINTLEYLYLGGRISQTTYKLGTLANIKPIINVDEAGRVAVPGKAMGMRKGMDTLCKYTQQFPRDEKYPFCLMYTSNKAVAEELGQQLSRYGIDAGDNYCQVGPAIGSHIGPEACGLVYIRKA